MQQQQQQPAPRQTAPQQPAPPAQPQQPRFTPQEVTPVVQMPAPKPTDEIGVPDVLLGSIALIGFIIAAALVIGLVTGGIFIAIRRWQDKNAPDAPAEPSATRLNLS